MIDHSIDLRCCLNLIASLQGFGAWNHAEPVGQMYKLEQVTIDGPWEDGFGDSFPANHDRKVHGCENFLARSINESITSVADSVHEVSDVFLGDSSFTTIESAGSWGVEWHVLVAKPDTVVEFLDAIIAAFHNLMDWSIASLRVISEHERQRYRLTLSGTLFPHVHQNLIFAS